MDNTEENVVTTTTTTTPSPAPTETQKPIEDEKKKTGNGSRIVAIVAILFACAGIGFGVYEMIDANNAKSELAEKDKKISALNASIDTLNTKIEELEGNTTTDDKDKKEETEYIEIEKFGIKIKKSKDFPDMVAYASEGNSFDIKESSSAEDYPPYTVSFMKISTCDDEEILNMNIGHGGKLQIGNSCFLMGSILPYGSEEDYPLTPFLKYVKDQSNFLEI